MSERRPRLLELFCGAGGAAMGYYRAGFDMLGVDIKPQPRYPFPFVQADALTALDTWNLSGFDAIHASPPCQAYSAMRNMWNARTDHPDLVAPVRARLTMSGLPWVIENVPGAPMTPLVMMCGSAFGLGIPGYQLRRHRWFEVSGAWFMSPPCQHRGPVIGIYGDHGRDRRRKEGYGRYFSLGERKQAMGIDWMARDELDLSIPPAYTEYIGGYLIDQCTNARGAAPTSAEPRRNELLLYCNAGP
jgi:DNA (cytosine-5)-methyltransferase 1